jgi:long-chain acyl-CoA synthetase
MKRVQKLTINYSMFPIYAVSAVVVLFVLFLRRRHYPRSSLNHKGSGQPLAPATDDPTVTLLGEVIIETVRKRPNENAFYEKINGIWHPTTWGQAFEEASRIAGGLLSLGVKSGQAIAILGPTKLNWTICDMAGHLIGAITVGIYPRQTVEQMRYLLQHSDTVVVFAALDEIDTLLAASSGLPQLKRVVTWTKPSGQHASNPLLTPLAQFKAPPPFTLQTARDALRRTADPSAAAILVYTSGTTGHPKGAMISHANILSVLRVVGQLEARAQSNPNFVRAIKFLKTGRAVGVMRDGDITLSFLPMAHVAERVFSCYNRINYGAAAAFASSMGAVLEELREVRPTMWGSVPRLFEKAYSRIFSEVAKKGPVVRSIFRWAVSVGRERVALYEGGAQEPSLAFKLKYAIADALVFKKVRTGGGRLLRLTARR